MGGCAPFARDESGTRSDAQSPRRLPRRWSATFVIVRTGKPRRRSVGNGPSGRRHTRRPSSSGSRLNAAGSRRDLRSAPIRPTPGPASDLRDRPRRHPDRRLDRRHPRRPARGVRAARRWEDARDPRGPSARHHQRVDRGRRGRTSRGPRRPRPQPEIRWPSSRSKSLAGPTRRWAEAGFRRSPTTGSAASSKARREVCRKSGCVVGRAAAYPVASQT